MNAYHLCWDQGFRVIALLPLIDRTPQADREKRTMILEKAAGELLGKSRTYPNRKARPSEWYFTTVSNVKKKLHTTFNDGNYKLTKPPVLKFEDDFINIFNVDGVKTIKGQEEKVII